MITFGVAYHKCGMFFNIVTSSITKVLTGVNNSKQHYPAWPRIKIRSAKFVTKTNEKMILSSRNKVFIRMLLFLMYWPVGIVGYTHRCRSGKSGFDSESGQIGQCSTACHRRNVSVLLSAKPHG